jgi:hypothetical protein
MSDSTEFQDIHARIKSYENLKKEFLELDVDEDKKIDKYIKKFEQFRDEFLDYVGELAVQVSTVVSMTDEEADDLVNSAKDLMGEEYDWGADGNSSVAQKAWNFLYKKIGNAYGVAGLMGNLYAESGLKPTNLQNTYEKSLGMSDKKYTSAVDEGTYTNFVNDAAGYGLAQWTYHTRKKGLLKYAKSKGTSIGDPEMQLEYLWKELKGYTSVLSTLKKAKSVRQASDAVLTGFERPKNQGTSVKIKRAGYGETYYKKFAKKK